MNSHKTAISRRTASKPLRDLIHLFTGTILDYGCGKGADVKHLKDNGYHVVGFDPYFLNTRFDDTLYDTVFCNYVINVISTKEERVSLLSTLLASCKKGGKVIVVSRSTKDIETACKGGNWKTYSDGYITGKNTFQRGFTSQEIASYANNAACTIDEYDNSSYSYIVINKG